MTLIKKYARKVSERLSYHFAGTSGGWNVPKNMPFMKEFLNEIRNLCDLCLRATEPKTDAKDALLPERTHENIVSSFFFYMWNSWDKEECNLVFGCQTEHFWSKWCSYAGPSATGAAERFYSALSDNYRRKLVERACTVYDGDSLTTEVPTPELMAIISSHLHSLRRIDQQNELSIIFMDEQVHDNFDMAPWLAQWDGDFASWYAALPHNMQRKVMDYYRKQKSL